MYSGLKKLLAFWRPFKRTVPFTELFRKFQGILERNNLILELMADMGDKLGGEYVFDSHYIEKTTDELSEVVAELIADFCVLTGRHDSDLFTAFERILRSIDEELSEGRIQSSGALVMPLQELGHELSEQAGTKMANLGDINNRLGLSTPDGFVITSRVFREFMKENGLLEQAGPAANLWRSRDYAGLRQLAQTMQESIMAASTSRSLTLQVMAQFDDLSERAGRRDIRVAVRSSAWGEDGESSFAGQYETVLNVGRDQLLTSYRRVVASAYSFEALHYRLYKGYHEYETAIAVGCQLMAEGAASGVLHTFAPHFAEGVMVASAVWGLCSPVMKDNKATDTIVIDRNPPYEVRSQEIACKAQRLVPALEGGTVWEENPEELQNASCLTGEQIEHLAQAGMSIERYYRRPQEIEWTYDPLGNLQILQVRPLLLRGARTLPEPPVGNVTRNAEVAFSGRGYVAQSGVAVGKVFLVENDADLEDFPHGAILLSRHTSPRYSRIMHKARGIITDLGSTTGHMSTLAREYRVPTIVNTEVATSVLQPGEEITLDASQNVVYRGSICALDRFDLTEEEVFQDFYEYRLLYRLVKKISPLTILDGQSDTLTATSCRSFHDIVRYIHEKSVEELILLSERQEMRHLSAPKRLQTNIPLGLTVIDAGDGTSCPPAARFVLPEQIVSLPLRELLYGLDHLGMWCTKPVDVDLGSFMSSFTRTFSASLASPREVGRNLVVLLGNFMNISMRLGYHFTVIDAFISEEIDDSYIYFRFLGGVTEFIRRSRRVAFIARVLEHFDFRVDIHGDLVVGRVKKLSRQRMTERMRMLGGLVGYTRQLDARMHSDGDVLRHAEAFIDAMNHVIGE